LYQEHPDYKYRPRRKTKTLIKKDKYPLPGGGAGGMYSLGLSAYGSDREMGYGGGLSGFGGGSYGLHNGGYGGMNQDHQLAAYHQAAAAAAQASLTGQYVYGTSSDTGSGPYSYHPSHASQQQQHQHQYTLDGGGSYSPPSPMTNHGGLTCTAPSYHAAIPSLHSVKQEHSPTSSGSAPGSTGSISGDRVGVISSHHPAGGESGGGDHLRDMISMYLPRGGGVGGAGSGGGPNEYGAAMLHHARIMQGQYAAMNLHSGVHDLGGSAARGGRDIGAGQRGIVSSDIHHHSHLPPRGQSSTPLSHI